MIKFTNVTKKYQDKKALSDANFEVQSGEIIGLLGVNGAGKTTTMKLIVGLIAPSAGEVRVNGHEPHMAPHKVASIVGYLSEGNPMYTDLKVREYLTFIANVKNHKDIDAVCKNVGLHDMQDAKIESLSRGYKQRVGLAAALLGNPKILLLDEPTSGLDPIEQDKIKDLIREVAKEKIVFFSTHILSEAASIATKILMIHRGQIVYFGSLPVGGVEALDKMFKEKVLESEIA